MTWVLAILMGWVLSGTLTLLSGISCDGSGFCEGAENKRDLTAKVEANTLLSNDLGACDLDGMGAVGHPNPIEWYLL
jgi:hypothetical protein